MIPCDECGHINRLGAIYCGACGAKLDMNLEIIEQSVIATAASQRANKIFLAGRNMAVVGTFLFVSAWFFRSVVLPPMPGMQVPIGPAMTAADMFNAEVSWVQPSLDHAPSLTLEDVTRQTAPSLIEWRRQHHEVALADLNRERISDWQLEVFNSRNSDGTWSGGDPVAATGLALLALMAKPGPPAFEDAIDKGLSALQPLVLRGSSGRDPIAHTIGIMALVEGGRLTDREIAVLRPALYRGDAPQWQALALLSFAPDTRPSRIAAIRSHTTESLWRHFLHFLSDQSLIEELDHSLFANGAGNTYTGIDRVAWVCLSFWMGRNVEDLRSTLAAWSRSEEVPDAGFEMRQLAGNHADYALAVMATCAILRAPIPWVRPAIGNN